MNEDNERRASPARIRAIALAGCLCAVALAPSAHAGTVVGQTRDIGASDPVVACPAGAYFQVARAPGVASYSVPGRGVVTRWSIEGRAGAAPTARLKVANGNAMVGETAAKSIGDGLNTFAVRVPVQDGDRIGLAMVQPGNICAPPTGVADDMVGSTAFEAPPGQTFDLAFFSTARRLNVAAVWEPDADRDGFGDESQDKCSADAGTQGECPPAPVPGPSPGTPNDPGTPRADTGGTQPPVSELPRDTAAPSFRVRAAKRQRVARVRHLALRVTPSEEAAVIAFARVDLPGVRLSGPTVSARRGQPVTLRLRASKPASKRLRRALARNRRVFATVTIIARDRAGNATTRRLRVRIAG